MVVCNVVWLAHDTRYGTAMGSCRRICVGGVADLRVRIHNSHTTHAHRIKITSLFYSWPFFLFRLFVMSFVFFASFSFFDCK